MALVKTYLLAPNFTFRPDGPIALGNIIADPFAPHRVLTAPDASKFAPAIETAVEHDYAIHRNAKHGVSLSIWAQFLETVKGSVGTDYSKSTSTEYTMSALKTRYFRTEPTEEEISARINVSKIRNVMRFGSVRSKPVYMVTGIKVAEGFAASTERGTQKGGKLGASAPVVEGISAGADVELTNEHGERDSFRAGDDVVFAYQLLEIGLKGWKEKTLEVKEFQSKAAFLGDESEEEESDVEVEASAATAAGLLALDREDVSLKTLEVGGGEERCVCIAFLDN